MAEEFIELINLMLNPETAASVSELLMQKLVDPDAFDILFEIIASDQQQLEIRKGASVLYSRAFSSQKQSLDDSIIQNIKTQIQTLLSSQIPESVMTVVIGTASVIFQTLTIQVWPELVEFIFTLQNSEQLPIILELLNSIIDFIPKQVIAESVEQLLEYVNAATHSPSLNLRSVGFAILSKAIAKVQNAEFFGDIEALVSPMLEYEYTAQLFNNQQTSSLLETIWKSLDDIIVIGVLPQTFFEGLLPIIFSVSTNKAINTTDRSIVLHTIIGVLTELSEEQITTLFDLIFELGKDMFGDTSLLSIFEVCFDQMDNDVVYGLIKERIEASLSAEDVSTLSFGIKVLSLVVTYAPDIAVDDITFIDEMLKTCLSAENDTLSEGVCAFLNSLDDTFATCTVMCSNMLMSVLPFLVSENASLRASAFSAVHCLCDMIDTEVDGFFQTAWELKDSIDSDDIESYNVILASSIKHFDIGDDELDALFEYVSSFFEQADDIDYAVAALPLVAAILKKDDSSSEEILPPSFELASQAILSSNKQTQVAVIDFIGDMYPFFHEQFGEQFVLILKYITHIALSILASDEREMCQQEMHCEEEDFCEEELADIPNIDQETQIGDEQEDDEGISVDTLQCSSISTLCTVAKTQMNAKLSVVLVRCIISSLKLEDLSGEIAKGSYEDSLSIIKLLNPESSAYLFDTLHATITKSENPVLVSHAMKPYMKLIRKSSPENEQHFHECSIEVIQQYFSGNLPLLCGVSPLEGKSDHQLMVQVAFLISDVVRIATPEENEEICTAMIQILQIPSHLAAFAYIGAFSDAVKYGKLSDTIFQQLFEIIPQLLPAAEQDPDLQQNIAFLINIVIQTNPSLVGDAMEIFQTIWSWFTTEIQQGSGWQLFLSNAASLILTISLYDQTLPEECIVSAFQQFPPYDYKETSAMCNTILTFFSKPREMSSDLIAAASIAISNLLLMQDADLIKRKVSQELYNRMKLALKSLVTKHEEASRFIHAQFSKSKRKLEKLFSLLE